MKSKVIVAKNITHLQKIMRQSNVILSGLGHTIQSYNDDATNTVIVKVDAIREFHAILKTVETCVIGLGTTVEQCMALIKETLPYPLLKECIEISYSCDVWGMSFMEMLFGKKKLLLMYLFLILNDASVQLIKKDGSLHWVSFKNLLEARDTMNIKNSIPIKIRMNLFNNMKHEVVAPSPHISHLFPTFDSPILLGQIDMNDSNIISHIRFLYYYNNQMDHQIELFPSGLKKFREQKYPLTEKTVASFWGDVNLENIAPHHRALCKQTLINLLSPNFV